MAVERLIIDCSVTMSWCFQDEANPMSDKLIETISEYSVFVPGIWPLEVANVILFAERRKRLTRAASSQFLHFLGALPIQVMSISDDHTFRDVMSVARECDLSSYDAAYLELAIREKAKLATLDKDLRAAAKKLGVGLL